jgi:hypothetical protein
MTYTDPDRPNPPRHTELRENTNNSMGLIIGGLVALALIIGGIFWVTSSKDGMVADKPAATTTGSGTTTTPRTEPVQPNNPAGNMPTAPTPPAPANR